MVCTNKKKAQTLSDKAHLHRGGVRMREHAPIYPPRKGGKKESNLKKVAQGDSGPSGRGKGYKGDPRTPAATRSNPLRR